MATEFRDPGAQVSPASELEAARQQSLTRYGLTGNRAWIDTDDTLRALVRRATEVFGVELGAVNVLDGDQQRSVLGTPGAPVFVSERSASLCNRLLTTHPRTRFFAVADASMDVRLQDSPWVNNEWSDIRFYASAFLRDSDGVALGTVCVMSDRVVQPDVRHLTHLTKVRDQIMQHLESRRLEQTGAATDQKSPSDTAPVLVPAATTRREVFRTRRRSFVVPEIRRSWDIAAVIEQQAITTVFQPVVHLGTKQTVGFEALSRGPEGSALESPLELFKAADAAGRVGELDWLCRVRALQTAAAANLHPSLSWFVNVEPAGLATECPVHLKPRLASARTKLRVILEIVERDIDGYAVDLVLATDRARLDSWGVALNDVGAEEGSLALLPFLRPDVIKLDMSLVQGVPEPKAAAITAAVRATAERTGAVILAEGIENKHHERLAVVFGATFAHGAMYGTPGALPNSAPTPQFAVPLRQHLTPLSGMTPYEILRSQYDPSRSHVADLHHISRHLKAQSADNDTASVLLVQLPHTADPSDRCQTQYRELAASNALTVVMGPGFPIHTETRYQSLPTSERSPGFADHIIIVINAHFAAAFLSRDCGDVAGTERRADFIYTHNRDAVIAAARGFLHALKPEPIDIDLDRLTR